MVPDPVPLVVEVRSFGVVPLQIVWFAAIAPAVTTFCTTIVTGVVGTELHTIKPTVDTVVRRYRVVVVSGPVK